MITASQLVERLRDIKELREVEGAAAFVAAYDMIRVFPAAYVVLAEETVPRDPLYVNAPDAHTDTTFAVFIAARNLSDPRGGETMETLEPLIRAVRKLLRGWQPEGACRPLRYVRARHEKFEDQIVWWRMEFTTRYKIED